MLLRFLAYLKDTGVICREIRSMTAGYTLSTVQINPVYMAPAWYIVTDIQSYYMDAVTGVVTVAGGTFCSERGKAPGSLSVLPPFLKRCL